jgi:hypothetical protein
VLDDSEAVSQCVGRPAADAGEAEALVRLLVVRHWVRELEARAACAPARIARVQDALPAGRVVARAVERLRAHSGRRAAQAGGDLAR